MQTIYRILTGINTLGSAAYLVICGSLMVMGQSPFTGQAMLLVQVGVGLLLGLAPIVIERLGHFRFPIILLVLFEAFIIGSVLLGTGLQCYGIPYWDKFLHLFSAAMLAGLGLAIFAALTPQAQLRQTKPLLLALFALAFGTLLGVCWEFYEFTGDGLLGLNMQRYMQGHTLLAGRAALMDTMGDLLADVLGSAALAVTAYFGLRRDPAWLTTFEFRR